MISTIHVFLSNNILIYLQKCFVLWHVLLSNSIHLFPSFASVIILFSCCYYSRLHYCQHWLLPYCISFLYLILMYFTWAMSLLETTSLPLQGRGKAAYRPPSPDTTCGIHWVCCCCSEHASIIRMLNLFFFRF